jgi:cobalt-zinc-cadmium efflux system outer membrane protein
MLTFGACARAAPLAPDLARLAARECPVLGTSSPGACTADPAPPGDPALRRLLALTDRSNPDLVAERKGIDVATAAIWQAQLYPNPTALGEVEEFRLGGNSRYDSTRRVGVRIPVVIGSRLRAARTAAEAQRDVEVLQYLWKRNEILLDVRRAYVTLVAARRRRAVAVTVRDLAAGLVDTARARQAAQVAAESEVLRAEVDLGRADSDIEAATREIEAAKRVLVAAVGAEVPATILDGGSLAAAFEVPTWDALRALTPNHPLVAIARSAVVAARHRIDQARAEAVPDLDVSVAAGENGAGDGFADVGVSIPIPVNDSNQARVAAARARHGQAVARVEAARRDVERRTAAIYRDFVTAEERTRRYRTEILPTAEKALQQTREGYEVGKLTYLDVLDARRTLSDARVAHVDALAELNLAAQELESFLCVRLVSRTQEETHP